MSILKVARMGHPVLRAKARALEPAEVRSATIQKLIDDMMNTMAEYHGVGLAAPQVHERLRLFVAAIDRVEVEHESARRAHGPLRFRRFQQPALERAAASRAEAVRVRVVVMVECTHDVIILPRCRS